jgi:hypothetical protein
MLKHDIAFHFIAVDAAVILSLLVVLVIPETIECDENSGVVA